MMMPDEESLAVETFTSWKEVIDEVCPRCISRYTFCELDTLKLPESDIKNFLSNNIGIDKDLWENSDLSKTDEEKQKICSLCLGLLQDDFSTVAVDKIVEEVKKTPREFKSFQLMHTLPTQLNVFHHLFLSKATSIYGDSFKLVPLEMKLVVKAIYDPKIATKLEVLQDNEQDGLQIHLFFTHSSSGDVFYPTIMDQYKKVKKSRKGPWWKKKNQKQLNEDGKMVNVASIPTFAETVKFVCGTSTQKLIEMNKKVDFRSSCDVKVKQVHSSIYVGGRYNKYSRILSQTPWFIDGKRLRENSVEEFIVPLINEAFGSSDHKFASSGREDVDVRMLGNGRPFIIELINPKKFNFTQEQMQTLEENINKQTEDVQVKSLQVVNKAKCDLLKEGEERKQKTYLATCRFLQNPVSDKSLEALYELISKPRELEIQQKTPIRVLHRRSLAIRPRMIYSLQTMPADPQENTDEVIFKIKLVTQAGTYVKEFVNGDLGRTTPSLKDLLHAEVDIIDLDVENIDLEWP